MYWKYMCTVSQKRPTFTTCYNFYIHSSIATILRTNVAEKVAIKMYFISPPHLTSASALTGERGNPEIASFHLNAACFFTKKHETQLKISPCQSWTTLHRLNDGCTRQDLEGSKASCCLLPTCSVLAKSVTVSVAVQKVRVVLRQASSKSQWTVLMGYPTISTNVRRYQTHHRWHFFLSGRQRTGALCV